MKAEQKDFGIDLSGFRAVPRGNRPALIKLREGIAITIKSDGQWRLAIPAEWRAATSTRGPIYADIFVSIEKRLLAVSLGTVRGPASRTMSGSGTISITPIAAYFPTIPPVSDIRTYQLPFAEIADDHRTATFSIPADMLPPAAPPAIDYDYLPEDERTWESGGPFTNAETLKYEIASPPADPRRFFTALDEAIDEDQEQMIGARS